MTSSCPLHVSLDDLLAYQLGESDPAARDGLEDHVFECRACGEGLVWLEGLASVVHEQVSSGSLTFEATNGFVARAVASGLQVREYSIAPGGAVRCTVAPDDALVVVRLHVPFLEGDEAVDLLVEAIELPTGTSTRAITADLRGDRRSEQVILAHAGATIRRYADSEWTLHARVRGRDGERLYGPYAMHHRRWDPAPTPVEPG